MNGPECQHYQDDRGNKKNDTFHKMYLDTLMRVFWGLHKMRWKILNLTHRYSFLLEFLHSLFPKNRDRLLRRGDRSSQYSEG